MWESRRDFQVLWADAVSVHQDGISIRQGRGSGGGDNLRWSARSTAPPSSAALNQAARDGESVRAVARALRCGLATVQRARLAGGVRGAPRPVSGSGPESGVGVPL